MNPVWNLIGDTAEKAVNTGVQLWMHKDQQNFQERMSNTAYQRGRADMLAAGLNPYLMQSGGSASSSPMGSSITPSNTGKTLSENYQQARRLSMELQQMALTNENIKADTSKKKQEQKTSAENLNYLATLGNESMNNARKVDQETTNLKTSGSGMTLENQLKKWEVDIGQKGGFVLKVLQQLLGRR